MRVSLFGSLCEKDGSTRCVERKMKIPEKEHVQWLDSCKLHSAPTPYQLTIQAPDRSGHLLSPQHGTTRSSRSQIQRIEPISDKLFRSWSITTLHSRITKRQPRSIPRSPFYHFPKRLWIARIALLSRRFGPFTHHLHIHIGDTSGALVSSHFETSFIA